MLSLKTDCHCEEDSLSDADRFRIKAEECRRSATQAETDGDWVSDLSIKECKADRS